MKVGSLWHYDGGPQEPMALWNWHWARFGKAWGEKNKCVSVWLTRIFHQNSFHFLISWFPDFPSLDFISWFYFQLRFYCLILLIFNTAFCKFRFYFLISCFPDFQLSIFQLSNFPDFQISSFFTFQDFQVSHFLISKCFVLFHISDIFNLVSCRHQQKYILLSWFHLSLIVSSLSTIFWISRS